LGVALVGTRPIQKSEAERQPSNRDRDGGCDSCGDQEALDFRDHGVAVEWYNAINPFDQQV